MIEIIPRGAPFEEPERAALNRYFGALLERWAPPSPAALPEAEAAAADIPWKDPALPLADRMTLAEGRTTRWRMHAAMAQQDCGQCGYTCATYSAAIFEQAEPRLGLCQPGGKATARMLRSLIEELGGGVLAPPDDGSGPPLPAPAGLEGEAAGSRANPAIARLAGRRRLNDDGSQKVTMHVEIDLTGTGLRYEAGDSLGLFATNPPELADVIIAALHAPPDFPILDKTLRDTLIEDVSLGLAPDALFELISYLTGGERRKCAQALARGHDPDGDLAQLDVLGAIEKFAGIRPDPEAFVESLEPLQPRLYSISSSPRHEADRVTLTVDVVRYRIGPRERLGVASTFLGERHAPGHPLRVYVQKAHGFALPEDPTVPIVMVGPGTGVAPFRAFLQERQHSGASGEAWLFFGHQKPSDFFYREEMDAWQSQGVLTRLSLAWSRDGAEKVYVQHRMEQEGAELFAWLERGAHFYICGDAKRMAGDVERTLETVIARHGGRSAEAAKAYVQILKANGRYQADIY